MKNIFFGFISVISIFLLTGCGSSKTIDFDKAYTNLESDYSDFIKVDADSLDGNYGIDLSVFINYLVVMSDAGTTSKMYAIFEAGDSYEDAKDEVTYFVDKYVQSWDNGYFPNETKLVNEGTVEKYGNYIIYVVNEDIDNIISKIKSSN
jgi:hypothetical protein